MEGIRIINRKESLLASFYLHLHTNVIPADAGIQETVDCSLSDSVQKLKKLIGVKTLLRNQK